MKRPWKIACAALCILCLCCALAAASAAADPEALRITKIEIAREAGNIDLQITLQNDGDAAIDEFGIALAFLDENGQRVFGYEKSIDGYALESCNWYYTPEEPIAAGAYYLTEDAFSEYAEATEIAVAIRYYHKADGDYIVLPESEWRWRWRDSEPVSGGTDRAFYTSPPDSLYDQIGGFSLGYSYFLLDDFNAADYGKNQGGEWIIRVAADSPAADAGFAVGDLVIFVDGVKPTENVYAVEYAKAAILNGEKVEWVYERDGVVYTTRVAKPEE